MFNPSTGDSLDDLLRGEGLAEEGDGALLARFGNDVSLRREQQAAAFHRQARHFGRVEKQFFHLTTISPSLGSEYSNSDMS